MKNIKYILIGIMSACLICSQNYADEQTSKQPVEIVKELYMSDLWKTPEEKFHLLFHPDYMQYWHKDNKYVVYDYQAVYEHTVNDLKNKYASFAVHFSHIISEGNLVFVRYVVEKTLKDDPEHVSISPMMALWEIKEDKLFRCWEMSVQPANTPTVFETFPIAVIE